MKIHSKELFKAVDDDETHSKNKYILKIKNNKTVIIYF